MTATLRVAGSPVYFCRNNFMLQGLPVYIPVVFAATTLLTWILFNQSLPGIKQRRYIHVAIAGWLFIQAMLAANGFYDDNMNLPPRFIMAVAPPLLGMLLLFATVKGRSILDKFSLPAFTWLQTVRIPVETVLYWLMLEKTIPQLMTFEGRNFDILAGITAPVVAWLCFVKGPLNKKLLLSWNIIGLLLVLNIVIHAALSVQTPFQQFAFEQPNEAVLKFPFIWLPSFIVPVVILGHLASLRQLMKK